MPKEAKTYGVSIRCFYDDGVDRRYTQHYQELPLRDIPRWIECYRFTHPNCAAITVKVWLDGAGDSAGNSDEDAEEYA